MALKVFFFQGIMQIIVEVMKHILTVFKYNVRKRGTNHAYYNICVYVYTYISYIYIQKYNERTSEKKTTFQVAQILAS